VKVVASALSVSDKLDYTVLDASDIDGNLSDGELESYWKKHKSEYMTAKKYRLSLVETDLSDMNVSEGELKKFYDKNSYNYTDADGKVMDFASARSLVEKDYRIKKGKKRALLDYIAFKKGKKSADRSVELSENDDTFTPALWKEIESAEKGDIIKPRPVGLKYVTVRLEEVLQPKEMSFEEAKERVRRAYEKVLVAKRLDEKAREYLESDKELDKKSDFISLRDPRPLPPLSEKETLQFLQKLFTSNKQKGMITVSGKRIVYRIVDQKIGESDDNLSMLVEKSTSRIKKGEFEERLIKELSSKYTVKKFVKGI
jgi:peptidyl-prolyl cis-trans isomerase D